MSKTTPYTHPEDVRNLCANNKNNNKYQVRTCQITYNVSSASTLQDMSLVDRGANGGV